MRTVEFMIRKRKPSFEIPSSPNLNHERALWEAGKNRIAGLDEAGRGAWAGPVVAAVVIFPQNIHLENCLSGVRDSKQLNARQRMYWAEKIKDQAQAWGVGSALHTEIDQFGILPATRLAMQRALMQIPEIPDHLLIDALLLPQVDKPQTALIKGDQRSLSIAAASILAKTSRDEWMKTEDPVFPAYGFGQHKGYGTRQHLEAIKRLGACPEHRQSFAPFTDNASSEKTFLDFTTNPGRQGSE